MLPKLYIGPVSKNTIDAAIMVANELNIKLGLIPSRRQVDYLGGYIDFNTEKFSLYVRERSGNIMLERDHGGPGQGQVLDDGIDSLLIDAKYFDIIHLDPFKMYHNMMDATKNTIAHLKYLHELNANLSFEIGTEEGIMKYDTDEFRLMIKMLWQELPKTAIDKIIYLVVQGGTRVREGKNIGVSNYATLKDFTNICYEFGKNSKEHNGDYISELEIKEKFENGLSALNIAPEFGSIESETYMSVMSSNDKAKFFNLVLNSKKWVKWFDGNFEPENNQDLVLKMCGHYVFQTPEFEEIKFNYRHIDDEILKNIKTKITKIIEII